MCKNNNLTSLEGSPTEVGGVFFCGNNELTSLEGCPEVVGHSFDCSHNNLTSLECCPQSVRGFFNCSHNNLTSLDSCPQSVGDSFVCNHNQLTSLEGYPEYVGRDFNCDWLILMHYCDISRYKDYLPQSVNSYCEYITGKKNDIPTKDADFLLLRRHKKNQQVINNLLKFASGGAIKEFCTKKRSL